MVINYIKNLINDKPNYFFAKLFFGVIWVSIFRKFLKWRQRQLEIYKIALALPHEPVPDSVGYSLDLTGEFKRSFPDGCKKEEEISKEMMSFLTKQSEKFKDEGLFVVWLANYKVSPVPMCNIFIKDVELMREVCKAKNNGFFEKGEAYEVAKDLFGNGLVGSLHKQWIPQRKVAEKGFTDEMMEIQFPIIKKTSDELIDRLYKLCPGKQVRIDFHNEVQKLTLDVLGRFAFGYEIGCLKTEGEVKSPMHEAFKIIVDTLGQRLFSPLKQALRSVPFKENRDYEQAMKFLNDTVMKIVKERKNGNSKNKVRDLLDILLESKELSDKTVVGNIRTMLFAGQDTTAATLTWAFYLLSQNQTAQNKLKAEISTLKENYLIADIEKMEYLNAVVLEVLRIYPIGGTARRSKKPYQLGKYLLPPDTDIYLFYYLVQRDKENYPNPTEFIPERWLDSESEEVSLQARMGKILRDKAHAYAPFSMGSRNCIGRKLALLEIRIVLIEILRKFEVLPTVQPKEFQDVPFLAVTAIPRFVRIILKKRETIT